MKLATWRNGEIGRDCGISQTMDRVNHLYLAEECRRGSDNHNTSYSSLVLAPDVAESRTGV